MEFCTRKTNQLRRGRTSVPGAKYFVTCCTRNRAHIFSHAAAAEETFAALNTIHSAQDADFFAATIMPNHVHLLFALGDRLRVGQIVAKFKSLARDLGRAPWRWQTDGFEHRLRLHESAEDYAFYIFHERISRKSDFH